jgi:hypothetical protein
MNTAVKSRMQTVRCESTKTTTPGLDGHKRIVVVSTRCPNESDTSLVDTLATNTVAGNRFARLPNIRFNEIWAFDVEHHTSWKYIPINIRGERTKSSILNKWRVLHGKIHHVQGS